MESLNYLGAPVSVRQRQISGIWSALCSDKPAVVSMGIRNAIRNGFEKLLKKYAQVVTRTNPELAKILINYFEGV